MSAWVLTWVVSVALLLVRSLSVVELEALAVLDRSVVRLESNLTTRLTPLAALPAVIVLSFQGTVFVRELHAFPTRRSSDLVPAGIGSLRTTPRASDGP